MHVIAHQAVCPYRHVISFAGSLQIFNIGYAILISEKDIEPAVAALHDMMGILGNDYSGDSCHSAENLPFSRRHVNINRWLSPINKFTAIVEKDGDWFIAYCPEIPGANGQGGTKDECLKNLSEAIVLILEDRRQDALRGLPPDALRELVLVFPSSY